MTLANNPPMSQKIMSATLEAIIGAVYLDGGLDAATTAAQNLGFNVLDGTIPSASFHRRTQHPFMPRLVPKPVIQAYVPKHITKPTASITYISRKVLNGFRKVAVYNKVFKRFF